MITRIYIDNFRCLTNFEIAPGSFQLWLGDNGSGKSTVCDALRAIQSLLSGSPVSDIFKASSLTTWDTRREQTFEITLQKAEDTYDYKLIIEHRAQEKTASIAREELKWNKQTFYLFDGQEVHLYRINRYNQQVEEGTSFSINGVRSLMATIDYRDDNTPLITFRDSVAKLLFIQPVPTNTDHTAKAESPLLQEKCQNFAAWYRHVLQQNPKVTYKANAMLEEVLPGFEQLKMKEAGDARKLAATFSIGDKAYDFDFSDISDGQRQLIILYTLLEAFRAGEFSAFFIDEPDNNVTLREIQPWVDELEDICDDFGMQAIIISHHPEIINKMARGDELWFSRKNGSHVVTSSFPTTPGLTPAETMARGWDDAS